VIISGHWHASGGAAKTTAALHIDNDVVVVKANEGVVLSCHLRDVNVSDRLGNIERKLTFVDIGIFSTKDNAAIDRVFGSLQKTNRCIHFLETHMAAVLVALVFTITVSFSFFKWGVPWVSETVAHALPHKTNELIAAESLGFLDEYWFGESKIEAQRQEEIRDHFRTQLLPLDEANQGINYRLHFRSWSHNDKKIPNAFALPSGDIILTDQFVILADNQDEMDSVLLHEIGHVVHRHSLEMVVQSTLVTTIVMLVTGDSSGVADVGLGLGALLVSSHYSRNHESEADIYAFEKMLIAGIDPQAFSTIMGRMDEYMDETFHTAEVESDIEANVEIHGDTGADIDAGSTVAADVEIHGENDQEENAAVIEKAGNASDYNDLMNYLSTHPETEARQKKAQQYSDCFKQGLTVCDVQ
jgi:Zn-dependent protease with chaperone function